MKRQIITFDLWGTLIKSNPEYIKHRNKLYEEFEVDLTFREKLKKSLDKSMEVTGNSFTCEVIYSLICPKDYKALMIKNEELVLKYPPLLVSKDIKNTLVELSKNSILGIISNTTFISGGCLRKVLINYGFKNVFTDMIFSDEVKIAKPNIEIFTGALRRLISYSIKKTPGFIKDNFNFHPIHIGNDGITDDAPEVINVYGINFFYRTFLVDDLGGKKLEDTLKKLK